MVLTNELVAPVVKWVGGKRQLLDQIVPLLPSHFTCYCEPFVGGAALLLAQQPAQAIINDINNDLIAVYEVIRDNVDELIAALKQHQNTSEYYYALRRLDRDHTKYQAMSPLERASRLIYLNKTCYNGLYRVNAAGEFNAAFGNYKHPNIVNEEGLRAVSRYFNANDITICNEDFAQTLARVPEGGFVYLDPPYVPVSATAKFTNYNKSGFDCQEQQRLKRCCDELNARSIKFLLSNSDTDVVKELYQDYEIKTVAAKRSINSNSAKRGAVPEVLIRNYCD